VDDLVVGQRQDEVLAPGVQHAERELVVMVLPVHGLVAQILEHVVHPPHVPLEPEAQTPKVHGARDHGPGGGLLGDGDGAGMRAVDDFVQTLEERDGLQVLAPAEHVRHPLAGLARVVAVDHRGDRVDAQAVGVVALEPEERVADEKIGDLAPSVVEDARAPVRVLALPRVRVLVQMRPVEVGEPVRVPGEVGRHPVEEHADAALVQMVHEGHEVVRATEAPRGA